MIKAVIFDLDGTLTKIAFDYHKAKKDVISFLISLGVDEKVLDENKSIYLNIEAALEYLRKNSKDDKVSFAKEKSFEILDEYEKQEIGKTSLKENALDLLSFLKEKGYKVAICTNNSKYTALSIINDLKISKFIDVVVTRDDVKKLKPYPDPLLLALSLLNVKNEEAVFIGDSLVDLLAAKAANIRFILISENPPQFSNISQNFEFSVVSSLKELLEFFKYNHSKI